MDSLDVMCVCPLLVPQNVDQTVWRGYISVNNQEFGIEIIMDKPGCLSGARINCDWKLSQLLTGYQAIIDQRLQQCTSLADFLKELISIVERRVENVPIASQPSHPGFYRKLVDQLQHLGWHRLVYIDAGFSEVHLAAEDGSQRSHVLRIQLGTQYPEEAPECKADVPIPFELSWSPQTSSLESAYSQFLKHLERLQEFWDEMDKIDDNTWVLEPENPNRSATTRRIAIGASTSIQISIDCQHPRLLPECRFLGPDHVVNPLKESLNSRLHDWDEGVTVLENLRNILEIDFPSPENTKKDDFQVECGICYAYRLEDSIPDQACDDSRCAQPFHHACLYEWLRGLSTSRQSFNMVFGECPYCSKPITVKMPT